jgi:hypothetical protein
MTPPFCSTKSSSGTVSRLLVSAEISK